MIHIYLDDTVDTIYIDNKEKDLSLKEITFSFLTNGVVIYPYLHLKQPHYYPAKVIGGKIVDENLKKFLKIYGFTHTTSYFKKDDYFLPLEPLNIRKDLMEEELKEFKNKE